MNSSQTVEERVGRSVGDWGEMQNGGRVRHRRTRRKLKGPVDNSVRGKETEGGRRERGISERFRGKMDSIKPPISPLHIRGRGPHTTLFQFLEFFEFLRAHAIDHDILRFGHQDLPPPEGHHGEEEQNDPGEADEDNHDDMPDVEGRKVEDVSEDPNGCDESDIRERQGPT